MKKMLGALGFVAATLVMTVPAAAAVPDLIPLQGVLADADGNPLDGSFDMRFAIYDAATDGNELWSELRTGENAVQVDDGFVSVYLGEISQLDFGVLLDVPELWLGVQVGADPEMNRLRLASVPFTEEAAYCGQVGDLEPDDIQPKLDFACGNDQFVRGWDADAGVPICGQDQIGPPGYTYSAGYGLLLNNLTFYADTNVMQVRLNGSCTAGSFVVNIEPSTGAITCATPPDEDTLADLGCGDGQVAKWNAAASAWTCANDADTQPSESDLTAMLDDNYAAIDHNHDADYLPSTYVPSWNDLTDVPAGFADGTDNDTTYLAGLGLDLVGTTFSVEFGGSGSANTVSRSDHLQAWSTLTGVPADLADGDNDTTYTAGTGILLVGTVFSADTTYLQRRVSGSCAAGQSIRVIAADGTVTCETDDGQEYTAGTGLDLVGTVFSVETNGITSAMIQDGTIVAADVNTNQVQARVSGNCAAGNAIRAVAADGTVTCEPDDNTTYTAGAGIAIAGNAISVQFGGSGVANTAARSDHTQAWSTLTGVPADLADGDNDTTYTAGTGILLAGTTFSADTTYLQRRVSGSCAAGNAIRAVAADGTVTCEPDDNTTYTAGAGIAIAGNAISVQFGGTGLANTAARSDHTQAWSTLTGVPADLADGDDDTTYTAGTGILLAGTTFSADTTYLQRRVSGSCAAGQSIRVIAADGTVTCETDDTGASYTAGNGLTLAGTEFSASYAGSGGSYGTATTLARSDHNHDTSYIRNQGTAAQTGQFWITGNARTNGNLRVSGLVRFGNETGTAEPPNYPSSNGMIIRRVDSANWPVTAGDIIARTDTATLERDGTFGGLRLNASPSPGSFVTVSCFGHTSTGVQLNYFNDIASAGIYAIYADSDDIVRVSCHFGEVYNWSHNTTVDLYRMKDDFLWTGFIMSTYNQ